MGSRDHSETCTTCGRARGGLNDYKCACDETREQVHQARLKPWSAAELMAQLCGIVDTLAADKNRVVSPLDVALELLSGELEAFVLFGRMGHLDSPCADGMVPIAVLQQKSEDPEIDVRIRETAQKWAIEQGGRS